MRSHRVRLTSGRPHVRPCCCRVLLTVVVGLGPGRWKWEGLSAGVGRLLVMCQHLEGLDRSVGSGVSLSQSQHREHRAIIQERSIVNSI